MSSFTWTISYHSGNIAIGSDSGDIIILDSTTGTQRAVLSGHTDMVSCVEFSSDGSFLVSGSRDKTIKLWDIQTGGAVRTFSGHADDVWCISISVDCTRIVSGSVDHTICLWNIQTGKCYCTLEEFAHKIKFSPTNPLHFMSTYTDIVGIDKNFQWDTDGHQIKPLYDGCGAAFSPDGIQFVSCHKKVVTIWNLNSEVITSTFHVGGGNTRCCCFSPDSRLVAVTAGNIIQVWNITSSHPHLVRTFIGHVNKVISIVFSSPSTLVSVSFDKSVKFWQVNDLSAEPSTASLESIVLPLVSSISLQVRDGIVISSDAAGGIKTWDISIGLHGVPTQSSTKDSRCGDTEQVNSRLIFVWYVGEMLKVWNAKKGEFIMQLHIPKHNTLDLRISGDGTKVFHIHNELIQAWDLWTGATIGTAWYFNNVDLLAVDGSRVWIEYHFRRNDKRKSIGWDFGTLGSSPVGLPTNPPARLFLSNTKIWDTNLCRILDIVTGKVAFQLPAQFGRPIDVQWNGQYLVISVKSKEELVLELHPTLLE